MQVEAKNGELVIRLADPVQIERLLSVLARSKSRKNRALLEAIKGAMIADMITPEMVAEVFAGFEQLLGEQE